MHYNRNKKEPCRNFQRGSCQYGEKCKFLHVTPEQSKPNTNPFGFGTQQQPSRQKFDNNNTNPFGFGTQQQHRKPNASNPFGFGAQQQQQPQKPANPFGFGVQSNNLHYKAPNDFGSKPHQFKPFENKWSRFSPISNSGQPDHQPQAQAANHHDCNDPDTCKRLILEDFEHERPLWKLTCYSHWKNGPCDISGDVSYEELRAVAYDDARRGLSLPLIVERERNLLNSKLIEFENLLQNPYVAPSKSALHGAVRFPVGTSGAATAAGQSSASTPFSNLSQSNVQLNVGHSIPANSAFGQSTLLPNSVQTSNAFGSRLSPNVFGQPVSLSSSGQTANAFGTNKFLSGDAEAPPDQTTPSIPNQSTDNSQAGVPLGGSITDPVTIVIYLNIFCPYKCDPQQ
ncbi:hypothetical protein K2173_020897 [Erythroxylum novogranatense]|uniref:C3H1-type domain-containing protein n=1 Tax=Erythroxylum novogranatense TaxID=1862640 RepID=A0AAV8TM82_9ROSI|nr:hypothetical protein K2173_020897 [Erythroxylum novogranatense]